MSVIERIIQCTEQEHAEAIVEEIASKAGACMSTSDIFEAALNRFGIGIIAGLLPASDGIVFAQKTKGEVGMVIFTLELAKAECMGMIPRRVTKVDDLP